MRYARPFVLTLCLALAGCANVMQAIQNVARPTASVTGARLSDIGLQSLVVDFDISVANPYSFDLPVLGFDFGLATNAQPFLNGEVDSQGSTPAQGTGTLQLPLRIDLLGLVQTVSGLRPGNVVPYDAELGLKLDVPGSGPLRLPLRKSGELPIPNVPKVEVTSMNWDEVSLSNVGGEVKIGIGNTNDFAFSLSGLEYGLQLAGREVGSGLNETPVSLDPGDTGEVSIPLSFSPREIGVAVLNVLTGSEADYQLGGQITLDSPFGPMQLPFQTSGVAPLR